jgi:hypothetical protein
MYKPDYHRSAVFRRGRHCFFVNSLLVAEGERDEGSVTMMMMITIIMSMGWEYVSELRSPTCLMFSPQVINEHGNHGGIISTGENTWFANRSLLASLPAEQSSTKSGLTVEGNYEFRLKIFLYISKDSVTFNEIFRHEADGFTYSPKKSC